MLLQSTINFITKVQLSMLFDNSQEKVVVLEKGQYVLIKFRHNGGKYSRLGKIKEIIPVVGIPEGLPACGDSRSPFTGCRIVVDFGSTFGSCQLTIGCNEILNIRILTEDKLKELLALGDELIITDEMFDESNDLKPGDEPGIDDNPPTDNPDGETPTTPDDGGGTEDNGDTENTDIPSDGANGDSGETTGDDNSGVVGDTDGGTTNSQIEAQGDWV